MQTNYKKITLRMFILVVITAFITKTIALTADSSLSEKRISSRKRHKNKYNNQKSSHKVITDMNYEELLAAKDRYKEHGSSGGYIKVLELLLKMETDTNKLADLMIELADAYYDQKEYKKATIIYNEFVLFYKGHEKIEYVQYRAIKALEPLLFPSDRDQTRTEEMLALIDRYLMETSFTQYKKQVLVLQKKCRELLFESKKNTCDFYLMYDNIPAATSCIERLKKDGIALLPEQEKEIIMLELRLARKKGDHEAIAEKETLLASQYLKKPVIVAQQSGRSGRNMKDCF